MKGVRSFLVLLVVAVALGGYLYYDSKRPSEEGSKQEKVFPDLQSDKIDQVSVKAAGGDRTTVQKQGEGWQITQPTAVAADGGEISGITSNLASMEVQRVVDEKPADLKQYGLDPPRIEVAFKSGGTARTVFLGGKSPTGSDLYAKVPDKPRVFLVPSYIEANFNKSTFDLRDKTILKVDRDKLDHIEIETPDHALKFARQGGDWRITQPVDARADFGTLEGILGRLNSSPMKAIVAPDVTDPKDLAQYGLDKPAATVHVISGSSRAGLAIGKSSGEGTVYAKDLSRPMVFTVETALADDLKKPADDFRLKDLLDARAFNTTRVEIDRKGTKLAFEKDKDAWKQVIPAVKPADTAKVEALLTALTNTRATGFVEKAAGTGLDAPELTAAIKFEDGKKEDKVSFGRKGTDAFAQRAGDPGAAKIDATALDAILKAADNLK
jgi:uncharacterized protein DUF4340